jgi:hypothetical protein
VKVSAVLKHKEKYKKYVGVLRREKSFDFIKRRESYKVSSENNPMIVLLHCGQVYWLKQTFFQWVIPKKMFVAHNATDLGGRNCF